MARVAKIILYCEVQGTSMELISDLEQKLGGNVVLKIDEDYEDWRDCTASLLFDDL